VGKEDGGTEVAVRVVLKDLVAAAWALRDTAHGRALAQRPVWMLSLVTLILLLAGSMMMWAITGSRVIPLVAICVPVFVAVFAWTFMSWRANDYSLLRARAHVDATRHWSVAETSRIAGVCASVLLCWGIGIGISVWSEPNWIGVTVSYLLSMLMSSVVLVVSYLNTFELRHNIAGTAAFASAIHVAYHCYMYWGQSSAEDGVAYSLILLASFVMVPVLVILHIGVSVWRDQDFGLPPPRAMTVSGVCVAVAIATCVFVLYLLVDRIAAICLAVFAVFMGLVVGAFVAYRTHGDHLSERAALLLMAVFVVLVAGAGLWAAFVQIPPMRFVGFTVSWLSLACAMVLYAMVHLNRGKGEGQGSMLTRILGSTRTYSASVFPAFTFDTSYGESQRLRNGNHAPMSLAAGLLMVFVWGLLASVLLRPAWVGALIYATSGLVLVVFVLHWGTRECAAAKQIKAARTLAPEDVAACKSTAAGSELFHLLSKTEHVDGAPAAPVVEDVTLPLALTLQELEQCYSHLTGRARSEGPIDVEAHAQTFTARDLFRLARQADGQYQEAARFHAHAAILMEKKVREVADLHLCKLRAFLHHLDPDVKGSDALKHLPAFVARADDATLTLLQQKLAWWDNHLKELAAEEERRRIAAEEAAKKRRQKEEEDRRRRKREEEERLRQEREREEAERLRREREEEERLQKELDEKRRLEELARLRQKREEEARLREEERKRREEARKREEEERQKSHGATVQEARDKLKAIEAECQASGRKWEDSAFPRQSSWHRCDTLGRNIAVIKDGAHPEEVCQGGLGDCWMISALSILALKPERIERLIVNTRDETHNVSASRHGVYCVRICKNGYWQNVYIDDYLPMRSPGNLQYAKCRNKEELWVPLIEKAFAKAHGSFEAIEGGFVHEALQDLTGPQATGYTIHLKTDGAADEMWKAARDAYDSGYMLGLGSNSGKDTDFSDQGIVLGHAFSLLMVKEVDGIRSALLGCSLSLLLLRVFFFCPLFDRIFQTVAPCGMSLSPRTGRDASQILRNARYSCPGCHR